MKQQNACTAKRLRGKFDPATSQLSDLYEEDYLNTGFHFTGISHWTGTTKLIMSKSTARGNSKLSLFDTADSSWSDLYSDVYYEFDNLGHRFICLVFPFGHDD